MIIRLIKTNPRYVIFITVAMKQSKQKKETTKK